MMPKSTIDRTFLSSRQDVPLLYRLLLLFLTCSALLGNSSQVVGQTLSKEGHQRKVAHDYLFQNFVKERDVTYRETAQGQGLKELTVFEGSQDIHNGDELLLPLGAEDIAVFFRHLAFRGAHLDRIEKIFVLPFSPDKAPPRSQQVQEFYRVQMPSVPLSEKPLEQMKIQFILKDPHTSCTVNTVIFIAQSPIATTFDTIPYRDLGSEFPRERVSITIDTDHELLINGTSNLDRSRWFRIHETPGSVHQSFEKWAAERNFFPGRGMLKFQPGLTTAWGNWQPLHERADEPGAADLSFFETYDAGTQARNTIPRFKDIPYASCFNDWPDFMSVPLIGRGTPKIEYFDYATDLAAGYVQDQIKDGGSSATWWEVKNESTFQSEWAYHWREKEGIDGWGLLSDFHNRVADAVHEVSPSTHIGGPAAAYMQLHQKDFGLFRDHARFIKETRGKARLSSHITSTKTQARLVRTSVVAKGTQTIYSVGTKPLSMRSGRKCTTRRTSYQFSSQSVVLYKTDGRQLTTGYEFSHGMLFSRRPCSDLIKSACLYPSFFFTCHGIRQVVMPSSHPKMIDSST